MEPVGPAVLDVAQQRNGYDTSRRPARPFPSPRWADSLRWRFAGSPSSVYNHDMLRWRRYYHPPAAYQSENGFQPL